MTARGNIVLAGILLLPFFVIPAEGMPFRLSREILAIWLGVGLMIAITPNWWLRGFLALSLVHLMAHPASIAYWQMMLLCSFCGLYAVLSRMDDRWLGRALWLVRGAALIQAGLILIQLAGIWQVDGLPRGMLANSNDAGAFLALSLPAFFVRRKWIDTRDRKPTTRALVMAFQAWHFLMSPILAIGALMATRCTTAVVAVGVGFLFWLLLCRDLDRKQKALSVAILTVLGVLFLWKVDPATKTMKNPRWHAWSRTVTAISDKPWGYGLGSYGELFPLMSLGDAAMNSKAEQLPDGRYQAHNAWQRAHNEYLQMTFELGLPFVLLGVGFFASFLTDFHCKLRRVRREFSPSPRPSPARGEGDFRLAAASGIVTLAVGCLGFFWLHLPETAMLAIVWLGIWDRGRERRGAG